jgi:hypothetical protein
VGTCGRGKVNGGDEGLGIWLMYFIYLYKNRTMEPVEIILSRGEEGE